MESLAIISGPTYPTSRMKSTEVRSTTHLFPRLIRATRLRHKLSQDAFGRLCMVSQPAVAGWESGTRPIQETTLEKIATALGEPLAALLAKGLRDLNREDKKATDAVTETPAEPE